MPDLAATDVTTTLLTERRLGDHRVSNRIRLAFGDGALTVPAGGIPMTKGDMGCPTTIESLHVVDKGTSGFIFYWDQSAEKMVVWQSAGANAEMDEADTVAIAAQIIEAEVVGF